VSPDSTQITTSRKGKPGEMNTRDLLFSGLDLVKQQASAVASTVSLAKPYLPAKLTEMNTGNIVAGLSYVKN
uniref:Uncharacterized protein n=1 Tax=Aegilops tauschii subsp. strangulata TaxID=200361 RepID=A0A453B4S8_AEGTS